MPNGNPKPLSLVQGHRTKAEIAVRAEAEAALLTEKKIKPSAAVKSNEVALKYFKRLIDVMKSVELDEAFYENVVNRYCLLLAEHDAAVGDRARIERNIEKLEEKEAEMEFKDYIFEARYLESALQAADKILAKRRDQLLMIEKENMLTIQGKLRAIPKKADKKEISGIAAYMQRRDHV